MQKYRKNMDFFNQTINYHSFTVIYIQRRVTLEAGKEAHSFLL